MGQVGVKYLCYFRVMLHPSLSMLPTLLPPTGAKSDTDEKSGSAGVKGGRVGEISEDLRESELLLLLLVVVLDAAVIVGVWS